MISFFQKGDAISPEKVWKNVLKQMALKYTLSFFKVIRAKTILLAADGFENMHEDQNNQGETSQEHAGNQIPWSWISFYYLVSENAQVKKDDRE